MSSPSDRDPRHHTKKMRKALQEIRNHLREDIDKVDEPQLKAMFETSAEVIAGLARISHTTECIGVANQRKPLCRNNSSSTRGAP
jgi:hypothetical protein